MKTLLARYPEVPRTKVLTAKQQQRIDANKHAARAKAMAKAASRRETEKADRAEANRKAALVKQKTKKERDAAAAAVEAAAVAASTKRNHASAFDCSQVSTQQEPLGSQEGPPLTEEPEAKKGKWSKDSKKRKTHS